MAGRSDEIEKGVNSIISESGVSFNPAFLSKDIIILSFQISSNLSKTSFIINLVAESRCINNRQRNPRSFFFEFSSTLSLRENTNGDRFNPYTMFDMCLFRIIGFFMFQYRFTAYSIYERRFTCSTCSNDH